MLNINLNCFLLEVVCVCPCNFILKLLLLIKTLSGGLHLFDELIISKNICMLSAILSVIPSSNSFVHLLYFVLAGTLSEKSFKIIKTYKMKVVYPYIVYQTEY